MTSIFAAIATTQMSWKNAIRAIAGGVDKATLAKASGLEASVIARILISRQKAIDAQARQKKINDDLVLRSHKVTANRDAVFTTPAVTHFDRNQVKDYIIGMSDMSAGSAGTSELTRQRSLSAAIKDADRVIKAMEKVGLIRLQGQPNRRTGQTSNTGRHGSVPTLVQSTEKTVIAQNFHDQDIAGVHPDLTFKIIVDAISAWGDQMDILFASQEGTDFRDLVFKKHKIVQCGAAQLRQDIRDERAEDEIEQAQRTLRSDIMSVKIASVFSPDCKHASKAVEMIPERKRLEIEKLAISFGLLDKSGKKLTDTSRSIMESMSLENILKSVSDQNHAKTLETASGFAPETTETFPAQESAA